MPEAKQLDTTSKPFSIMKRSPNSYLLVVGDTMVCGEFPHTAYSVYEGKARLTDFARAFSVEELEKMLAYRKEQMGIDK